MFFAYLFLLHTLVNTMNTLSTVVTDRILHVMGYFLDHSLSLVNMFNILWIGILNKGDISL